jgi:DNA-binding beta-propeller fold protein YncE
MRNRNSFLGALLISVCALFITGFWRGEGPSAQQRPAGLALEYIGEWGTPGEGPGELQDPASIAADTLGNVFIADPGTGFIHKFAPRGKALLAFQQDGLKHPQWIAVDGGGTIYVTDPARGSVFLFFPGGEGNHYRELRLRTHASANNSLSVAVGADGLIYIFDAEASKCFTFNARLRSEQSWAPPGSDPRVKNVFGPIEAGKDGFLYLAKSSGSILKLTREGRFVAEIAPEQNEGKWNPTAGFAVSNDEIFVMENNGRTLHVVTTAGNPRLDMDLAPQLGQGTRPAPPLAVSAQHELLVLDAPEHRVLGYRITF